MMKQDSSISQGAPVSLQNDRRALLAGALAILMLPACGFNAAPRVGDSLQPGRRAPAGESNAAATPELPALALEARYVLLGEVHDNPNVHRLRLEWLRQLCESRPCVIAMEQFDLPMQPQLDAARERLGKAGSARKLAEAGGFSFEGWEWALYEPVIELALQHGLPLVAANLERPAAMMAARGESGGDPRPTAWRPTDESELTQVIRDGHCGVLPERVIPGLVRAQLTRDRTMASAMTAARSRYGLPVVLLAGNGHVRRDLGVPRHLAELEPGAAIASIGIVEQGDATVDEYDRVVAVEPFARPDPCQALQERFKEAAKPST